MSEQLKVQDNTDGNLQTSSQQPSRVTEMRARVNEYASKADEPGNTFQTEVNISIHHLYS
jgi:hypothetical protein